MPFNHKQVAVVIPAFNEEQSIAKVVTGIVGLRHDDAALIDQVVVCDNGSTDKTASEARRAGASVVYEPRAGYGAACLRAIESLAEGSSEPPRLVVFVDGDCSVTPEEVLPLLESISQGADLVVGARDNEFLDDGAMSPHQRFGNRLAAWLIRMLWRREVSDLGPFRAIRYSRLLELNMQDRSFGWTVEMQVKAIQAGFVYREVPVSTRCRIGVSKISGTVSGTIGAAVGIFSKIFSLYINEKEFVESIDGVGRPFKLR